MGLQGKVLGYSEEAGVGAITGPDGRRYNFSVADWNGDGAPVRGEPVDFEPADDGRAIGVYSLRPGAAAGAGPQPRDLGPDVGRLVSMAARRPELVAAVLALVICVFVGFIEVTRPPNANVPGLPDSVTVLEVSELMAAGKRAHAERAALYGERIEDQGRALEAIQAAQSRDQAFIRDRVDRYRQMRDAYGPFYGYERAPDLYAAELTEQSIADREAERTLPRMIQAEAQARLDRLNRDEGLINLGLLLYLIPLSAAWVLFSAWTKRSSRLASVALGLSVAVGIGTVLFIRRRLGSLFGDLATESQLTGLAVDRAHDPTMGGDQAQGALGQSSSIAAGDFVPDAAAALSGEALLTPGLGAWLLVGVAASLIAITFGLVKIRPNRASET